MAKGNYFSSLDKKKNSAMQNISSCSTVLIDASLIDESEKNQDIFSNDEKGIQGLSEYMKEVGVHEPIACFQKEDGRYEIVSGHRRFKARLLKGDTKIDVIVTPPPQSKGDMVYQLIFDNIHARQLKPMDLARALYEMKTIWVPEQREKGTVEGDTKDILAAKFNMSTAKVSRYLRLLKLNPELQDKVQTGVLSVEAALVLISDDNNIDGLQDYINEAIDSKDEVYDETSSISKTEVQKMIHLFKKTLQSMPTTPISEENSKDTKLSQKVSRKKFEKSVESFHQIINMEFSQKFKLNEQDIENLESLQTDLSTLIQKYKHNS